jgi:ribosomal protein S18 acetylase RimI-like enzyme
LIESAAAAASFEQISLSVAVDNPALRLYQRLGFKIVAKDGTSFKMLKKLRGEKDTKA